MTKGMRKNEQGRRGKRKDYRLFITESARVEPGKKHRQSVAYRLEDEDAARPGMIDPEFVFNERQDGCEAHPPDQVAEPEKPENERAIKGLCP